MSVGKDDVKKLARLTRLSLSPAEEDEAVASLNAVLSLLDELRRANTEGIDALTHVQGRGQTLRCRAPAPAAGIAREELLKNAPRADGEYFLVPKVIE